MLFVCSSPFTALHSIAFVLEWTEGSSEAIPLPPGSRRTKKSRERLQSFEHGQNTMMRRCLAKSLPTKQCGHAGKGRCDKSRCVDCHWPLASAPAHATPETRARQRGTAVKYRRSPRSVHHIGQARRCRVRPLCRSGLRGADEDSGQQRSERANATSDDQHDRKPSGKAAAGDLDQFAAEGRRHMRDGTSNVAGDDSRDDELCAARNGAGKT